MIPAGTRVQRGVLSALYHSRIYRLLEGRARGLGTIFTLHHVRSAASNSGFSPNRILEITPHFLEETIQLCKRLGHEFVSLDECRRRIVEGETGSPFVCFTLDDGYRDNYAQAFPIFREHGVPFAIFLCPGMMEDRIRHWWRDLEDVFARHDEVEVDLDDGTQTLSCATDRQKMGGYLRVYWALRRMPYERQMAVVSDLVERYLADPVTRPAMLTTQMVDEMRASGLLTIGAHTMTHPALAKLPRSEMMDEMARSRDYVREQFGVEARHLAYPYGDPGSAARREFEAARELGFDTAVTTRKGVVHREHAAFLHALPRVSLNGDYQSAHFVELFLTGVPFSIHPRLPRINVA